MSSNNNNNTPAGGSSANSRELELAMLAKSHGADAAAQARAAKLLGERYSLGGSQKPFLVLGATELRDDARRAMLDKTRQKAKAEKKREQILSKTMRKEKMPHGEGHADQGGVSRTGKKAKIRHSRLQHARHGLREYIAGCQKRQHALETKLRNLAARRESLAAHLTPAALQAAHGVPTTAQFAALNELWNGYVQELLFGGAAPQQICNLYFSTPKNETSGGLWDSELNENLGHRLALAGKLASADFHGARIRVVSALNPSLVGMEGTVIWEAKTNFVVVVDQKRYAEDSSNGGVVRPKYSLREQIGGLRIVEKRGSVFRFTVRVEGVGEADDGGDKEMEFDIVGSRFIYRTAERSGKKFKPKSVEDLL